MSEKSAKKKRQVQRNDGVANSSAARVRRAAEAVLAVKLDDIPVSTVSQFAVGWLRAAFEQSQIIAELTSSGRAHAAAPNRRTLWEIVLRLHWLADMPQPDRNGAAHAMLAHERKTMAKTAGHMDELGFGSDIDVEALNDFVLEVTEDKVLRDQAEKLTAAVYATELNSAVFYRLWREDSTYAHATGFLAGYYAPAGVDTIGSGHPPAVDEDLEAHRLTGMFIVVAVGHLLIGEGISPESASTIAAAYFEADEIASLPRRSASK
ncbi:hypothetical protein [Plantibacter sp. CFBP 13570]|uniref:hypothetical protein n=1 Tax=Plantibacter sp. CFBP 13570 TaxID=2775272 RepID=UPI001930C2D6|nr:hypothetical protein [Plantibacter sp. CFBP 13570]MBD8535671.1 hypothetical protein [Plantibacter sp. CFBP 13570]